jgi:hypothetical protein
VPFRVRKGYNCQTGTPPCGADIPLQEHDHERRARSPRLPQQALRHDLTAINQYWLHYRLLDNWGYNALAKQWPKESIEEIEHADKLVDRIIFLDGFPNMQVSIRCTSAKP